MVKHITANYLDRSASVIVTNDDNGKILVAEPISTAVDYEWWLWLDELSYAVFEPSVEGGTLEIIDQDGDARWTINTDSIKEGTVEFGHDGLRIGQNGYLTASVANSPVKQASVSLSIKAHATRRKEYYG